MAAASPPVKPAEIMTVLLAAEDRQSQAGWDVDGAIIGMIFRVGDPQRGKVGYMVEPFPIQADTFDADDWVNGLLMLGGLVRTDDQIPRLTVLDNDDVARFVAVVVVAEYDKVRVVDVSDDDDGALCTARVAVGIDVRGGFYNVVRARETEQVNKVMIAPVDLQPPDTEPLPKGSIVVGLRDLLLGIARQLPDGYVHIDSVAALGADDAIDPDAP